VLLLGLCDTVGVALYFKNKELNIEGSKQISKQGKEWIA
jgi:hypothetical protein